MRVFSKGLKTKAILLSTLIMLNSGMAFSANSSLSEIKISSTPNDGYNITLKTDKNTSYKTSIKDNTKLIVELKNTVQSENLSTLYNSVPTINNVSVMESGKDSLKIQILGRNVDRSIINIEPTTSESTSTNNNKTLWGTILACFAVAISQRKRLSSKAKKTQTNLAKREVELAQKLNSELKKPQSLRAKISKNTSAPSINYAARSNREPNKLATSTIKPTKRNIITYPQNKVRKHSKNEYASAEQVIGLK